jgi:recombination protein RecA
MSRLIRRKLDETAENVTTAIRSKRPPIKTDDGTTFLSTGSTLLNLALSDNPRGGFKAGKLANIIGDSSAGKTFLLWSIFAEAANNKQFGKYDLFYDETEAAFEFNVETLFGQTTEKRVIIPTDNLTLLEDYFDLTMERFKSKKSFVSGLDSFDGLSCEAEMERDIREGSYKMEKAKLSGEVMRKIVGKVEGSDSFIFVLSQTRDKIGVTFGSKKTRSGGKALEFYSSYIMWLAIKEHIKRSGRDVGINVLVKISKNKYTGKLRRVEFPIYFDYGIDDISSMIEFLLEEKVWKKEGRKINTAGFCETVDMGDLVNYCDSNKEALIDITTEKWFSIEDAIKTERPKKYGG